MTTKYEDTLKELDKHRQEMEKDITEAVSRIIYDFVDKTGMPVRSIDVDIRLQRTTGTGWNTVVFGTSAVVELP